MISFVSLSKNLGFRPLNNDYNVFVLTCFRVRVAEKRPLGALPSLKISVIDERSSYPLAISRFEHAVFGWERGLQYCILELLCVYIINVRRTTETRLYDSRFHRYA